jgi:hypothetical protein
MALIYQPRHFWYWLANLGGKCLERTLKIFVRYVCHCCKIFERRSPISRKPLNILLEWVARSTNRNCWKFVLWSSSGILKNTKEQNVSEADLFPSSDEGERHLLCWIRWKEWVWLALSNRLKSVMCLTPIRLRRETDPVYETLFSLEYRMVDKVKKKAILYVTHHHQNPSTICNEFSRRILNLSLPVGFDVLTAVVLKSPSFWHMTPCCPLKIYQLFEEYKPPLSAGRHVSPKRQFSLNELRGVIC